MKSRHIAAAWIAMAFVLSGCVSALPMDNKQIVHSIYHPIETATVSAEAEVIAPVLTTNVERVETIVSQAPEGTVFDSAQTGGGLSWLISVTKEASPTLQIEEFEIVTDQDGNIVSKKYLEDRYQLIEGSPQISSYGGDVVEGSYFFPKMTTYGVDCKGCGGEVTGRGGTALGIKLDIQKGVRQADGTYLEGITYNGYYLVAADKNIPLGSILEITEHSFSGEGLVPGEPFKAIVADRGGAVNGAHLDIYVGSQKTGKVTRTGGRQVKATIICVGRSCYQ